MLLTSNPKITVLKKKLRFRLENSFPKSSCLKHITAPSTLILRQDLVRESRLPWNKAQAGLKLTILLPQPPKCWDYECMLSCSVHYLILIFLRNGPHGEDLDRKV